MTLICIRHLEHGIYVLILMLSALYVRLFSHSFCPNCLPIIIFLAFPEYLFFPLYLHQIEYISIAISLSFFCQFSLLSTVLLLCVGGSFAKYCLSCEAQLRICITNNETKMTVYFSNKQVACASRTSTMYNLYISQTNRPYL